MRQVFIGWGVAMKRKDRILWMSSVLRYEIRARCNKQMDQASHIVKGYERLRPFFYVKSDVQRNQRLLEEVSYDG